MNKFLEKILLALTHIETKIMKLYDQEYEISDKGNDSPVTEADILSNTILCETLSEFQFPILSEESEDDTGRFDAEYVWVIDPLDGTKDFIQKTGEFSVMIGLLKNNIPYFGVVAQVAAQKIYFAEKGKGAFVVIEGREPQSINVSSRQNPQQARFVVSRNHLKDDVVQLAKDLEVENFRKCGSNGIKIGCIAEGKADLFVNTASQMGEWDICGSEIILTEAGGIVTDTKGQSLVYNKKEPRTPFGIVASNGHFHSSLISYLSHD